MSANKAKMAGLEVPECPVCLETMTAPIFLCQSGHSLCASCTEALCPPTCPMCRQPMTQMRNRSLEDIINKAKMPCPNRAAGCVYTLSSTAVADHLKECIFRRMECPVGAALGRCSWTGELKHMANHFKEKHSSVFGGPEMEIEFPGVTLRECDRQVCLAALKHLLFIITVKIDTLQGKVYWAIQLIGPKKTAQQHVYEIHLTSKRNPQRKVVYTEHCYNDTTKADDIFSQSNCAIIPLDMLAQFMMNNKLIFNYRIRRIANEPNSNQNEGEITSDNKIRGPRSASSSRGAGRGAGPRAPGPKGPAQQRTGPKKNASKS